MGVSTSASLLVIFISVFIAAGTVFSAGSNALDRVNSATTEKADYRQTVARTSINVTTAEWDGTTLTIRVNNTGESVLSVNDTTVLVDGEYVSIDSFTATVDGQPAQYWASGEQLVLQTDSLLSEPARIKLVTGVGVAGTESVEAII